MSHWPHWIHLAHRADEGGSSTLAALVYIVVGLFFAPMLIGIPVMIYGFYKLCK